MKPKYIIGGGIILVFIVWAFISFNKTLTPYVSIAQARELESTVQVKGSRIGDSQYNVEKNILAFRIADDKGDTLHVEYSGVKPGNFDQTRDLVCIGIYSQGKFKARELLVKCPSKYLEEEKS
jgi:cytochrome c-type biogenesis protein CcmE